MPPKYILVTGATGRQGLALINALRPAKDDEEPEYHILALTRDAASPSATSLAREKHVTLVQGDLDKPDTIRQIFSERQGVPIWGVYCVLAFPGLGASADGEERQGKMLADFALEFGVSVYVYSSNGRGKEANDETATLSNRAKAMVERHVQSLGDKGLPWCIMRPGFFMENYNGTIGSVTAAVLKCGLKPDTTVQLIAADDIGRVAAAVFRNPSPCLSQMLSVVSERLTMAQQQAAYKEATSQNMTSIPNILARLLITLNKHTKEVLEDIEIQHRDYANGENPNQDAQMKLAHSIYPDFLTFKAWAGQQKSAKRADNWNQVSLVRLLLGKH